MLNGNMLIAHGGGPTASAHDSLARHTFTGRILYRNGHRPHRPLPTRRPTSRRTPRPQPTVMKNARTPAANCAAAWDALLP